MNVGNLTGGLALPNRGPLDDAQLSMLAPAVFAKAPAIGMTARYQFLPTIDVVNALRDQKIYPVAAAQRRSRGDNGKMVTKHMVRFSLNELINTNGQEDVEIVMINSHNGLSTYRFALGVFRLVCTNGLVAMDKNFGETFLRHLGSGFKDEVNKIANTYIDSAKLMYSKIEEMKSKQLDTAQRLALASKAAEIRWGEKQTVVDADTLLQGRRVEDAGSDLWTVFNVVQENVVRGGFQARSASNPQRVRRVREVQAIDGVYNVNKKLWEAAAEFVQ